MRANNYCYLLLKKANYDYGKQTCMPTTITTKNERVCQLVLLFLLLKKNAKYL